MVNLPKDVLDTYNSLQKQAATFFDERDDNSEDFFEVFIDKSVACS